MEKSPFALALKTRTQITILFSIDNRHALFSSYDTKILKKIFFYLVFKENGTRIFFKL